MLEEIGFVFSDVVELDADGMAMTVAVGIEVASEVADNVFVDVCATVEVVIGRGMLLVVKMRLLLLVVLGFKQ